MVSVNPNPVQGLFFFDPLNMGHPGLSSLPPTSNYNATTADNSTTATAKATASTKPTSANTMSFAEDLSKKIRKPYTITKSRESWTEQEHDKFLEALQLFDRDWKKIEAFIGSKTVIQIRSHAQKYFMKVQKNGTSEHVPPPRPKRKAAHPYPQKAPKNVHGVTQVGGQFQSSATLLEQGYIYRPDSSYVLGNAIPGAAMCSWSSNSVPPASVSKVTKDDVGLAGSGNTQNICYSSSNDSTPRTWPVGETIDQGDQGKPLKAIPDFAQVYSFLGSVFDPTATGHIQRLKQMDPINFETVLLLMRNLAINLTSPEFEDHKRLLSLYDAESEKTKIGSVNAGKSESAIPSV